MIRYCSLFSGSSGNCTYVATSEGGLLVDVGVSAKRIENALLDREIDPKTIRAVLITHEHGDHVAGLKVLCKRYGWPVLASEGTLEMLAQDNRVTAEQKLFIISPQTATSVAGMRVTAFSVPHDSRECLGFRLDGDGRSVALATDMGCVTPETIAAITGCDLIHIESNHDPLMLQNAPYPYHLKQRILGRGGHLSNAMCAEVLPSLVRTGTTRFVLAHISQHSNTPLLAQETSCQSLTSAGISVGRDCLLTTASPVGEQPVTYF